LEGFTLLFGERTYKDWSLHGAYCNSQHETYLEDALGDDNVYGNAGNDYVEGDYGHDYISTGDGSDKVAARDGYKDRIVCGQGAHDVVYVDPIDVTQGCEHTTDEKPSP